MDISPNEVKEIKSVGNLHGDEVKMVVTDGGFHLFVGKKKKTSKKSEVLAASSHRALGLHQIQKEFGADFEPMILKNEQGQVEKVEEKTEYLPSEMIAKGVELFTLSKGSKIDFILYKHGLTIGEYSGEIQDKTLVITKGGFSHKDAIVETGKTAKAMSRAVKDKVHELKLKGVKRAY